MTLSNLVKDYDGKVRVVYKHMVVHPDAVQEAHMASCAAGRQGKFMEYKHAFWELGFNAYSQTKDPSKLGGENLRTIAQGVGLDLAKFEEDIKGKSCNDEIEADMAELSKFGVRATPSFFINGKFIGGALPEPQFKQLVEEQLKIAEASGVPGEDYYQKEIFEKGEKKFRSKKEPKPQ